MINKQTTLDLNGPILSFIQQPVSVTTSISIATFVGIATATFPSQTPTNPASSTGTINYRWHAEGVGPLSDGLFRGATITGTATTTLALSNLKSPETNNVRFFLTADYIPSAYSQPVGSAVTSGTARSTGNAVNDLLSSNIATLTVNPFITITKQPTNTTIAPGGEATFDVDATLSDNRFGELSYQWQSTGTVQNGTDGVVNFASVWGIDARGRGATTTGGGGGGSGTTGYSGRPGSNGTAGTFGQGGNGGYLTVFGDNPGYAGGGGGGFYGGGGGGVNSNFGSAGSGGGGAGYIIGGSPEVSIQGYRSGNGIILVSWTVNNFSSIGTLSLNLNKSGSLDVSISPIGSYTEYRAYVDGSLKTSSSTTTINNIPITSGADRTLSVEFWNGDTLIHTLTTNFRLFEYTGSSQSWVVPSGVGLLMSDVQGAQGGSNPGSGGRIKGNISVIPGTTIYMLVGGQGGSEFETTCRPTYPPLVAGGFNGGGTGGGSQDSYLCPSGQSFYRRGAGGGGASDIRTSVGDLTSRLIVAGGGGGGSYGGGLGGAGDGAGQNLVDQSSPLIRGSRSKTLTISASTLGISGIRAVVSNPNAQSVISNVVSFDVVNPRAVLNYEYTTDTATTLSNSGSFDLKNGRVTFSYSSSLVEGVPVHPNFGIVTIYAPERDVNVRITLAGSAGGAGYISTIPITPIPGGPGGVTVFDLTLRKNIEYVIRTGIRFGLNNSPQGGSAGSNTFSGGGGASYFYRQSQTLVISGGGGGTPINLPDQFNNIRTGGAGGGALNSGSDGVGLQDLSGRGGIYVSPGSLGVSGSFARDETLVFTTSGSIFTPSYYIGGKASSCVPGSGYWAQQGVSACSNMGFIQARNLSGTIITGTTSSIERGHKYGIGFRNNGGNARVNNSRYGGAGGDGAYGGSGGGYNVSPPIASSGGGGSGYTNGEATIISSIAGGNPLEYGYARIELR
jgi:hypothetical protein